MPEHKSEVAAALERLVNAVGSATVVHLVAHGPIRLEEGDWRTIEAAAATARTVLETGVGDACPSCGSVDFYNVSGSRCCRNCGFYADPGGRDA